MPPKYLILPEPQFKIGSELAPLTKSLLVKITRWEALMVRCDIGLRTGPWFVFSQFFVGVFENFSFASDLANADNNSRKRRQQCLESNLIEQWFMVHIIRPKPQIW